MTADEPHVLGVGGVFIPAAACGPLWRVLLAEQRRRQRETGSVLRPDLVAVLDALRQATADHEAMSANGRVRRTSADTGAASQPLDVITTAQLADHLHVTARHVRRLAATAGIDPIARNTWRTTDIPALKERTA